MLLPGLNTNTASTQALMDSIKADHGYNMDSKSVKNLLQTMSELNTKQRRDFLQFTTGSPKLPIGGRCISLPIVARGESDMHYRLQATDAHVHGCLQTKRTAVYL